MRYILCSVEVLVGCSSFLLKHFTFPAKEEMKPVQTGSSGAAVFTYKQSARHAVCSVFY